MTDDKTNKKVKVFTKDSFTFAGILLHIDADFLQILDTKTDKEMTFPISNVARIEEVKQDGN